MTPRDFLDALENPDAPPLRDHDERGLMLLRLVAQLYLADAVVDDDERAQLARLGGDLDIDAFLDAQRGQPLDVDAVARLFPEAQQRQQIIELLEHAMWGDDHVDLRELDVFDALYEALIGDDAEG